MNSGYASSNKIRLSRTRSVFAAFVQQTASYVPSDSLPQSDSFRRWGTRRSPVEGLGCSGRAFIQLLSHRILQNISITVHLHRLSLGEGGENCVKLEALKRDDPARRSFSILLAPMERNKVSSASQFSSRDCAIDDSDSFSPRTISWKKGGSI
jgi:hypothetical protein